MKIFYFILILSLALIGRSFSEITYLEILKNPTDLRLNLQYAKEQEKKAEYKSVIATLERLTKMLLLKEKKEKMRSLLLTNQNKPKHNQKVYGLGILKLVIQIC